MHQCSIITWPSSAELLNYRPDVQSTLGLDEVDEEVGGGVVGGDWSVVLHLWLYGLGELLAQLHPVNRESKCCTRANLALSFPKL